ncbi:endonuclease/exonuclease/phosphatase family protein [Pseudogemmobacter faecipullorum]|uniref:endonuclease/exonuclease/phosphatase family protein n=1 Tax=Pseudogemmobacter faecipullorum TaxID=2755041 RepID=UPI00338D5B8C
MLLLTFAPLRAESLRLATWNSDFERKGPGLLLRDISSGKDPQIGAALHLLAALQADVLLLSGFDYDHDLMAARAFAAGLRLQGLDYPWLYALRPNRGMQTGLDLDGDGRKGGPGDAQGFGWFAGQSGMLLLSRYPVQSAGVQDYSTFLWRDLPDALLPDSLSPAARAILRLSTTAHWQIPLLLPGQRSLTLLAWHASPPVFDGADDLNGRRNHDETAFWLALLSGQLGLPRPATPFVLIGTPNLDPEDGEGRRAAIRALLAHPALQDPAPRALWSEADPGQKGDPALDTVRLAAPGGLRLAMILPDRSLKVTGSGVFRPRPEDPLARASALASRHFPIWVDLQLPD